MSTKLLWGLLLLAAVLLYYRMPDSIPQESSVHPETASAIPQNQTIPVSRSDQDQSPPLPTVHRTASHKPLSPRHTPQSYPLFEEIDPDLLAEQKMPEESDGATAIHMDAKILQQLKQGDQIEVPVSEGIVYRFHVIRTEQTDRNGLSIQAKYYEEGHGYDCIITHAQTYTLLTLTTPVGSYEARLTNENGVLLSRESLNKMYQGYQHPDTLPVPTQPQISETE